MANPVLRWKKSPTAGIIKYAVSFDVNGFAVNGGEIAQSSTKDSVGYSATFGQFNPDATLNPGDIVDATVSAVSASGLASVAILVTLAIPNVPPEPPTDVVLSMT